MRRSRRERWGRTKRLRLLTCCILRFPVSLGSESARQRPAARAALPAAKSRPNFCSRQRPAGNVYISPLFISRPGDRPRLAAGLPRPLFENSKSTCPRTRIRRAQVEASHHPAGQSFAFSYYHSMVRSREYVNVCNLMPPNRFTQLSFAVSLSAE